MIVLKSCVLLPVYSEVRLMTNGYSQCEGQVEMNFSGRWRALCASHWSLANANVVCHQLGCGVAISTPRGPHFVEGSDQISTVRFHCSGAEFFLWSCPVTALGGPDCSDGNTAYVICSGKRGWKGYWYSWSDMSARAENEGNMASKIGYFMVKSASSHCSFIFQVRARSVKGNSIFLSSIIIYKYS